MATSKKTAAPVFYALAHIQFAPDSDLPLLSLKLQGHLVTHGCSDVRQDQHILAGFAPPKAEGEQPTWQQQTTTRLSYSDKELTNGYVLLPDAVVYHTTAYESWTEMRRAIGSALEWVAKELPSLKVIRIGLRYLDAIVPDPGESLKDYLAPQMAGMAEFNWPTTQGSVVQTANQFSVKTSGASMLVCRLVAASPDTGDVLFPVELMPLHLQLADRFRNVRQGLFATMDTDHFAVFPEPVALSAVASHLDALKDGINDLFYAVATPEGLQKWGIERRKHAS